MSSNRINVPAGRAHFGTANFAAPVGDPYEIFVSSASECDPARRLCRKIINDAVNPALGAEPGVPMLVPVMWEDALPKRIEGESVNAFFVRLALMCHATIVLLESRLGEGTRDEVMALLALPAPQRAPLAVVVFEPGRGETRSADLIAFLRELSDKHVLYASAGRMRSQDAWITLSKVICGFAFSAARKSREQLVETDDY